MQPCRPQSSQQSLRRTWLRVVRPGRFGLLTMMMGMAVASLHADQFTKPTKEELSMTSLPEYPGASAVVLYREQITTDDAGQVKHYDRIKILTEDGKKYANVELGFFSSNYESAIADDKTLGDIAGRTIHPDGTIVPFTGQPYVKVIEQGKGYKRQEKVFSLPDVTVGSIIEYRYTTRINDHVYEAPNWYIQGNLYVKSAHYLWVPTNREMTDAEGNRITSITWFPLLPQGTTVQKRVLVGAAENGENQQTFEVTVKDIPPAEEEEDMPPIRSLSYRVLFNRTPYYSGADFWKAFGKRWSKSTDSFIGPNADLTAATQAIIKGATTEDQKLRKIYAAVMELENTAYTREHERDEDKATGLGKSNSAADILARKRGNPTQLTLLFVGMARAAGMKAYAMVIPDRSSGVFTAAWQNSNQFDGTVAIVNVDGKEQYFDPGQRYCEYGRLAWQDTRDQGLRQNENGPEFGGTPGEVYTNNKTARVANLTMDGHGELSGRINVTFTGGQALHWRQQALKGDKESVDRGLSTMLQNMVPKTVEVKVTEIKNLADYEHPLVVTYDVKGTLGTPAGKRVIMPADLFVSSQPARFPHEKREYSVYFPFPESIQDAVRINLPSSLVPEATPEPAKVVFSKVGAYNISFAKDADGITVRRDFAFNEVIVGIDDYADLRKFYTELEAKDHESVVLKAEPAAAAAAPSGN